MCHVEELEKIFVNYVKSLGEERINIFKLCKHLKCVSSDQLLSLLQQPTIRHCGGTVLHWAARKGDLQVFKTILQSIENINDLYTLLRMQDADKETVLHQAAEIATTKFLHVF